MKQKRPKTPLWNRALALLMAVFVTVQLTVPAYAEMNTEPVEQDSPVTETQLDEPELPAEPEALPVEETEAEAEAPAEEAAEPAENAEDETPAEDAASVEGAEPIVAAEEPSMANSLDIPGYTRVTNANLATDKYYLIVTQDSNGKLYALYPDKDRANTPAGNAIGIPEAKGCFVAKLNIADGQVTAVHESDQQTLAMDALHFTATQVNHKYTFRGSNGLYLALQAKADGDRFLTERPANFTVTAKPDGSFTLYSDGTRILDFNLKGDEKEFTANGKQFETNFWGPSKNPHYNIYLYTKNDAVIVNKEGLKAAIEQAQKVNLDSLSAESAADIQNALQEAIRVRDDAAATSDAVKAAEAKLNNAVLAQAPKKEMIAEGAPKPGTTQNQPFPQDVAGLGNYRIPSIITLKDGTLVSAIDARWNHHFDGYNIDTMLSISKDNGQTWNYSFPNFFNDSVNQQDKKSTAFIDPVLAQGKDGTLYLMVDLMPGGNYTGTLKKLSGYETVDNTRRMVLYTTVDGHTHENYAFYVGDFKEGYAPVIAKGDSSKTPVYYVDEYYYIYNAEKKPIYCQQLGSEKYVQQNVFFTNAMLHVAAADFLWLVTSQNGGETWSAPTILNPQVRDEFSDYVFYGVGPGAGICMDDGTVLLPCYDHKPESANFVYTCDQGKTWHRAPNATPANDVSSESALVKIDEKTVRQFYRDSLNDLRYTDFTWHADSQTWTAGEPVKQPGVVKATQTELSAIRYSGEFNGKPVILVSTATGTTKPRRTNGKIYAFNLESDKTMTHIGTYEVTQPGVTYAYSSLTELKDGSIGLLYESHEINPAAVTYLNLKMEDILQLQRKDVALSCGENAVFPAKETDVVINGNSEIVDAKITTEKKNLTVENGAQGHHGENVNFTGKLAPLSDALFQFVGNNDTGIQITAQTEDGTQVWLSTAAIGLPSAKSATNATLTETANGTFLIHTDTSYLYFWRDNSKRKLATFDRVGNPKNTPACEFKLYRPAAAGEQNDIPGYVQVKTLAEVKDGGFYLIAASVGNDLYVLNPSTSGNKYAQSLKMDLNAEKVTTTVPYQEAKLTLMADTAGEADVQVGSTIYHVTVSHTFEDGWKHDADPAHGHWHYCSGCMKVVDQTDHTFVDETIQEPTCTDLGRVRHTCTECGFSYETSASMIPHTLEHVPEIPATIGQDGILEHWKCTVCGRSFVDENGQYYIGDELLRVSRVVTGDTEISEPVVKPEATQAEKDAIQSAHSALKTPDAVMVKGSSFEKQISISADNDQNHFVVTGVLDQTGGKNEVIVTGDTIQQVIDENHLKDAKEYLFIAEAFLKAQVVDVNVTEKNDGSILTSSVTYRVAPYANLKVQSELGDALVDTVPVAAADEAVTITLTLPDSFEIPANAKIQVEYVKQDGTKGYYDVVRDGSQITFEAVEGFGEFTVVAVVDQPIDPNPQPPVDPEQPVNPDSQSPVNPEQPVDPVKPVEPTKPADKDPGHVTPPTGDSTPVFLWSMIAVVCIACIAVMLVYRKKKNHN